MPNVSQQASDLFDYLRPVVRDLPKSGRIVVTYGEVEAPTGILARGVGRASWRLWEKALLPMACPYIGALIVRADGSGVGYKTEAFSDVRWRQDVAASLMFPWDLVADAVHRALRADNGRGDRTQ